jgi:hypothetical protein
MYREILPRKKNLDWIWASTIRITELFIKERLPAAEKVLAFPAKNNTIRIRRKG